MQTEVHQLPTLCGAALLDETVSESRRSRRRRTRKLVDAAKRREAGSFEALYAEYLKVVNAVALSYGPLHEKEDVIQESFLLALEKLHTLRNTRAFAAWLRAITKNVAISHLRRSMKHVGTDDDEYRDPTALTETQRIAAITTLGVVRALPEEYREIIVMAYAEGMSRAEIADVTGLTEGSVRVKLGRGLEMLRAVLGKQKGRR